MILHMVKDKTGKIVKTRCGLEIEAKSGQFLPDLGCTGSESRVSCPDCALGGPK